MTTRPAQVVTPADGQQLVEAGPSTTGAYKTGTISNHSPTNVLQAFFIAATNGETKGLIIEPMTSQAVVIPAGENFYVACNQRLGAECVFDYAGEVTP